jgi:hypothetical protein
LQAARGDQLLRACTQAAKQRRDREHAEADAEHTPPAEEVADTAAEQQQPTEGKDVSIDDPRQRGRRDSQLALDARQRNVGDGVIEDEHQLCRRDDDQRQAERTRLACLRRSRDRHV